MRRHSSSQHETQPKGPWPIRRTAYAGFTAWTRLEALRARLETLESLCLRASVVKKIKL